MIDLVVPPTRADIFSLVDVSALKEAKRVTNTKEDAFIRDCILDAWSYLDGPEGKCRRAVLPQRWAFTASALSCDVMPFPVHGARGVVSVTYYDASNVQQTADPGNYWIAGDRLAPALFLSSTWARPTLYDRHDAVRVVFDAGWPTAADVPRVFRRALLLLTAHLFDNREETFSDTRISGISRKIEYGLDKLLEKYIVPLDFAGGKRAVSW